MKIKPRLLNMTQTQVWIGFRNNAALEYASTDDRAAALRTFPHQMTPPQVKIPLRPNETSLAEAFQQGMLIALYEKNGEEKRVPLIAWRNGLKHWRPAPFPMLYVEADAVMRLWPAEKLSNPVGAPPRIKWDVVKGMLAEERGRTGPLLGVPKLAEVLEARYRAEVDPFQPPEVGTIAKKIRIWDRASIP